MRSTLLVGSLFASITVGGCAGIPRLVPSGGAPQAVATEAGATITVVDQEWEGSPDDLGEYVTIVPVELYNEGQTEVRVSYFDFALVDEGGFRYKALNPFMPAQADNSQPGGGDAHAGVVYPEEVNPPMTLVAGRGGFHGGGVRVGAPRVGGPRGVVVRPGVHYGGYARRGVVFGGARYGFHGGVHMGWRAGFGTGYGYGGWRGYRVFPYYRPWLGAGFGYYWTNPFFWPPGYAAWVLGWSPAWYPSARTVPEDMMNLGLPEGVLEPGGHVAGYVYFQHARPGTKHMALTWELHEAREGAFLGQDVIQLDVVGD